MIRIKILMVFSFFVSFNGFSQKPMGEFEHRYFTEDGFGETTNIKFLMNDSFYLKKLNHQICYQTTEEQSGVFRVRKDTLLLIYPISKNSFSTTTNPDISNTQFVYLINQYDLNLKSYLTDLRFYFLAANLELIATQPEAIKILVDRSTKNDIYTGIFFKFNIPQNALFFMAESENKYLRFPPTTIDIVDIRGKQCDIDLEKHYRNRPIEQYLMNKDRTTLTSIKQQIGPVGRLITIEYKKK